LYGVLLVLILIAIWIPIFVLYFARDVYVYGKSAVLAFADTGAELRILLPSLFLLLVSIAVWENRRSNRIPIIKGDTAILRVKKPLKKRVQNGALFASVYFHCRACAVCLVGTKRQNLRWCGTMVSIRFCTAFPWNLRKRFECRYSVSEAQGRSDDGSWRIKFSLKRNPLSLQILQVLMR
jgi:hypothetical protein